MSNKLFEYVIIFHEKRSKKADEESATPAKSTIVADVTRVLAKDEKVVSLVAAKAIPDKYNDKLDQVEILVRPF